jgi:hypothetical protein
MKLLKIRTRHCYVVQRARDARKERKRKGHFGKERITQKGRKGKGGTQEDSDRLNRFNFFRIPPENFSIDLENDHLDG